MTQSSKLLFLIMCRVLLMAEWFSPQNWKRIKLGGAGFNSQLRLLSQSFGVFHDFFRNSCKYGLGSLRKTLHGVHFTERRRCHMWTIGLIPTIQPNQTPGLFAFRGFLNKLVSEILKNKNLCNESLNKLSKNCYFEILVLKYLKIPEKQTSLPNSLYMQIENVYCL